MKYILITLLFTTNLYAQMKLEITPSDNKYAKMHINCKDQSECDSKLIKWIDKQKFFKGEWNENQENSIASRVEVGIDQVEKTYYFHPLNFSVNLTDISAEISEREAKKLAKKNLKDKLNSGNDLTLKEINDLLRD